MLLRMAMNQGTKGSGPRTSWKSFITEGNTLSESKLGNLKSGTNKNGQIQSPSGMGGSGFGKVKELDRVEVGEMKPLPNHSELESVDDFNPTFKGIEGMGKGHPNVTPNPTHNARANELIM
ncbi:hypothetical protein A3844_30210 [Paenibacillus helianthi]|uniref:Uncharacterized protein n=1 Tax=Paenibacillus helianthi TaxID=1349432 RepID=A0ABX3EGL1_9BACL|nr:hypothetical protein [Paenibacillus helianthi]OKP76546.1 hypothetical protein A3844_30210 [Paenibacillus helianthi]